ncbi:MAG: PstS family phosphate ABC transporter substrate-binding protein [Deltaproteobacteria bacterium]|nr:PstS family phosphate ABC transporter substrate-binding protein [Deltaproteobacteria bacterium]
MCRPSFALLLPLVLAAGSCSKSAPSANPLAKALPVAVDGSSTVLPIAEAVAEETGKATGARVIVGVSGTGGGMKRLCAGEIAIANASRPIKSVEVEACERKGIRFIELPVAYDGLAVVVHPGNTWASSMTVAELNKLWQPAAQRTITRWSQVRAGWPDDEIHLFGAGVDSGTYDYFTQAIVGKEHESRGDYTSSEDDNVLVKGVAGDRLALGFFGLAYAEENAALLKLVAIDDGRADNGAGPVLPSKQTVLDGSYQPLSRPLLIYVEHAAADRPEVQAFVSTFLTKGAALSSEVGYVPLPARAYELASKRFTARTLGSAYGGQGSRVGVTVLQLLSGEG